MKSFTPSYFFSLGLYASLIFLNKGFIVHRGGGKGVRSFKKQRKTNKGRVVKPIPTFSNFLMIFLLLSYIYIYIYIYIYLYVNKMVIFERGWGDSLEQTYIEWGWGSHIK